MRAHPVTTPPQLTDVPDRLPVRRCAQCGERIESRRSKPQPGSDRTLCVDCAFDSIPCTD